MILRPILLGKGPVHPSIWSSVCLERLQYHCFQSFSLLCQSVNNYMLNTSYSCAFFLFLIVIWVPVPALPVMLVSYLMTFSSFLSVYLCTLFILPTFLFCKLPSYMSIRVCWPCQDPLIGHTASSLSSGRLIFMTLCLLKAFYPILIISLFSFPRVGFTLIVYPRCKHCPYS